MGEQVVVRGTVIGDAGKPVAGWVSLGKKQPQRFLSRTVRITSSEGHEVTLEDLDGNEIRPIATRDVKWQELEGTEIGNLCAREAPAPDVEIDLREAILRGGDKVAAWGEVLDRGYIGGASQRGSVEGGITKLRVMLVQVGDDCEEKLEARRESMLAKQRKEDERYAEQQRKNKESDLAAVTPNVPKPKVVRTWPWETNPALFTAVVGIAVFAALGLLTGHYHRFLAGCAAFAFAPRALDAAIVPRFRNGRMAPGDLQVPIVAFAIASLVSVGFPIFSSFGKDAIKTAEDAARIDVILIVTVGLAALATLWLSLASRQRRRYLAILANAPAHPDPIKDGVWGASVGKFSKQILATGADYSATGSGKNTTVRESGFVNMELQAPFVRESSGLDVQCGDAAVLTLAKTRTETGDRTWKSFHYIDSSTPTIVAGRATDGILKKGGEASLMIFASAPKTDVRAELAKLRRREWIGGAFAVAGVAMFVALFFV